VHTALKTSKDFIVMTPVLKQTLKDWRTLIQKITSNPTSVKLLISEFPNIIEFTDACKLGAGGVIAPDMDPFQHWVWQYEWPLDIQQELVSDKNRTGKLTINDLELAGLVLGWLVLEYVSNDLTYKHIGLQIHDIGFWKDGKILPRDLPLHILETADSCTMKISNQKNGRTGQTLHHESTGQRVQLQQLLDECTTSFPMAETAKTSFAMYASTTNGIRLKARR